MTIFNAIYRCLHHRLGRDPEQASKAIFVAARGYEKRKMTRLRVSIRGVSTRGIVKLRL